MNLKKWTVLTAAVWMWGAAYASDVTGPNITLDGQALARELMIPPDDRDSVDSVIVASNGGPRTGTVVCSAFNSNGRALGSGYMRVPGKGLRYIKTSVLSNGIDFVGQVRCRTGNQDIVGTAFLFTPGNLTSLPVAQQALNGVLHIQIPVTASY